jgi:3-hydroxyisobutyrate dehydrogenase
MGSEMAFNLFSMTFAERPDSRFLVCDTNPEVVQRFRLNFLSHFPSARVDIAATPEE